MTNLLYHPRSIKFLKKLPPKEAQKIISTIGLLGQKNPPINLDIKKLVNAKRSYRLRVGNIRVVNELDTEVNKIYISDIDFRGNIY